MNSDILLLIVAVSLFVGGHELLSHPLRAPIVRAIGEKGFTLVYALVAFASLGWAVQIWKGVPQTRLWLVSDPIHWIAVALMLCAEWSR